MTETNPAMMPGGTPEELRERAAAHLAAKGESIERSDTDGFVSQWAHGVMSRVDELAAKISANNGYHRFPALYRRDGSLVQGAKELEGQFGWFWSIRDADGARLPAFTPSRAKDWRRALKANARKGYFLGTVLLPAYATTGGGGRGLSGAMNVQAIARPVNPDYRDYVILDNGSPSISEDVITARLERSMSHYDFRRMTPEDVRARVVNELLYRATMWDAL